jgi:hypothetical protein
VETVSARSYVIVASVPRERLGRLSARRPQPRPGRHRLGAAGTAPHRPHRPDRPTRRRGGGGGRPAARHRRGARPAVATVRYASLLVLVATLGISGWFTASGAAVFAQMIQP